MFSLFVYGADMDMDSSLDGLGLANLSADYLSALITSLMIIDQL